jgi:hypothetical protein
VLEWPPLAPPAAAARWVAESLFHGQRTTLCFTSVYPEAWLYFAERAATVTDAGAFAALADQLGAGWILVHKPYATLDPAWAAAAGASVAYEDAEHVVYLRPGGRDARAQWNGVGASLNGADRSPIPDQARRSRIEVSSIPVLTAGMGAWLDVRVTNGGPHPWAGDAPRGPGVVRLTTRWLEPDGSRVDTVSDASARARRAAWPPPWRGALLRAQALPDREHPLKRDVAPGETIAMHVPLVAPPRPGSYVLEIRLEQLDVGAFQLEDGREAVVLPVDVVAVDRSSGSARPSKSLVDEHVVARPGEQHEEDHRTSDQDTTQYVDQHPGGPHGVGWRTVLRRDAAAVARVRHDAILPPVVVALSNARTTAWRPDERPSAP